MKELDSWLCCPVLYMNGFLIEAEIPVENEVGHDGQPNTGESYREGQG